MPGMTAFGAFHRTARGGEFRRIDLVTRRALGTSNDHVKGVHVLIRKVAQADQSRKQTAAARDMAADSPPRYVPPAMVRFENVGMRYGAGPEVLRDVTFTLEAGSFTFLTGLSGAGKSTLLKLIFLAEPPSRGVISLFGHDIATTKRKDFPALRRRIGVVFQNFRLLEHLSAFDNVALPLRLAGGRPADYAKDVEELLSWVGLGDRMQSRPPHCPAASSSALRSRAPWWHGPRS